MALNPNIDWPSRPRSPPRANGPQAQDHWPSEERILSIRYRSKMNGGECWAVFEGTEIRELTRHSIEPTNADLAHVATEWSLQIG